MKIKKIEEKNVKVDKVLEELIGDTSRKFIPKLTELLRMANKLTDNNIKLLIDDCYGDDIVKIAEQLRLANKLTDDNIKLLIKQSEYHIFPKLAEQIKLAGKLTHSNIELLINIFIENVENYHFDYITDLVEQLPDNYKPTDKVVKILQEKGYEVLD